jgi:hypothetical protein
MSLAPWCERFQFGCATEGWLSRSSVCLTLARNAAGWSACTQCPAFCDDLEIDAGEHRLERGAVVADDVVRVLGPR